MYELVHYVNADRTKASERRSAVYIAGDDVDDLSAAGVQRLRGGHVTLEDGRKGCPVRDVENAEGADRHMQVDGVDVAPPHALADRFPRWTGLP